MSYNVKISSGYVGGPDGLVLSTIDVGEQEKCDVVSLHLLAKQASIVPTWIKINRAEAVELAISILAAACEVDRDDISYILESGVDELREWGWGFARNPGGLEWLHEQITYSEEHDA